MNSVSNCFFCNQSLISNQEAGGTSAPLNHLIQYNCKLCGNYIIDDDELYYIRRLSDDDRIRVATYLQERKLNKEGMIVIHDPVVIPLAAKISYPMIKIQEILDAYPKNVSNKLNRALCNLSKQTTYFGQQLDIDNSSLPILYALNTGELEAILNALKDNGYIKSSFDGIAGGHIIEITAKGYDRIYELEKVNPKSKQAFVAMWFDSSLGKAYTDGFEKAIKEAGYESKRIDREEFNNKIDDEIVAEIKRSKFLVADFTGHRGGVYYESGFAHGLGIPVIFTCRKDCLEDAHFDTEHYNHIVWENEEELYKKLLNRIRATIS